MTNEQAKKMLEAKLKCLIAETSGIDCNDGYNCDECELLYAQGTAGEQKEAIDMAIKALEQQLDKVIHDHPCEHCYYNDGEVHAECVICDKPLEQQPCEDAVSRQALIDKATSWDAHFADSERAVSLTDIMSLPSVTPKYTDEEIQKMQELEQAQLEKAYELGKTESFEDWLSSFNTDSATECFTAVQELKKKMEGKNEN